MTQTAEFRVGLLGLGAIAQVVHLPILHHMKGVQLAAVCDVDQAKAKAIASRFGIERVARNDDEVFAADDLDAVVIATPSHLHEAQAIAALQGRKHVLLEKPLAIQADAAARVIRAAEQAGKALMVAMNNRYRPDTMALKPFATGGELGVVFLARGAWLNRKMRVVRPTWRHRLATAGGGALIDLGVQTLDLAMWFLDFPKVKSLVCHTHPGEGMEVEDSAAIILRLENGSAISLSLSWSLVAERDRHYMRLLGTRGSGSIQPLTVHKEIEHGILDVTPQLPASNENIYTASYRAELEDFIATARGEKVGQLPVEQVELMRLVGLAYQSAREEREIEA
ncbi:MAG TPA: Gfo/Idh/MocA family oxidoreductase [Longimicrobiales bacterium]|nr:Gfo/Idh/MocA family oxidoreductase [Longimicrobiales bacterium]